MKTYMVPLLKAIAFGGILLCAKSANAVSLSSPINNPSSVPGFTDFLSFEARWIAGAANLAGISEARIGLDAGTTAVESAQVNWVNGSSLTWMLTYVRSTAVTTLSLTQYNGQPIQPAMSYDFSLNNTLFDRFRISIQAQANPTYINNATQISVAIDSVVGTDGNNATFNLSPGINYTASLSNLFTDVGFRLEGTGSLGATITQIMGTVTLNWDTLDPQPNTIGGANERLRVRLFGYNSFAPLIPPDPFPPSTVPEPGMIFGLLAVGAIGAITRRTS